MSFSRNQEISDVIFRVGRNGPYAECNVILCPYWSGNPAKMGEHMIKVHGRDKEGVSKMVIDFTKYIIDNDGSTGRINVLDHNLEIREEWKIFDSDTLEGVLDVLNDYDERKGDENGS